LILLLGVVLPRSTRQVGPFGKKLLLLLLHREEENAKEFINLRFYNFAPLLDCLFL
jgi:hypothetical protein